LDYETGALPTELNRGSTVAKVRVRVRVRVRAIVTTIE